MRTLERKIGALCRAVAVQVAESGPEKGRLMQIFLYVLEVIGNQYVLVE